MKFIFIILAIVAVAWAGNNYYNNHPDKNFFSDAEQQTPQTKCITADGNVIYGRIPEGVICQRTEVVKGSLTIVPSQGELQIDQSESVSTNHKTNFSSNLKKCDRRTHCSQMTSCEEAKYFLSNCPGVKMDGNNDGVPCETQWCN